MATAICVRKYALSVTANASINKMNNFENVKSMVLCENVFVDKSLLYQTVFAFHVSFVVLVEINRKTYFGGCSIH